MLSDSIRYYSEKLSNFLEPVSRRININTVSNRDHTSIIFVKVYCPTHFRKGEKVDFCERVYNMMKEYALRRMLLRKQLPIYRHQYYRSTDQRLGYRNREIIIFGFQFLKHTLKRYNPMLGRLRYYRHFPL